MSDSPAPPSGPDLTLGLPIDDVVDGTMIAGHVGDDAVLLARRGDEFFAIGATCTHYNGPLAEGIVASGYGAVHRATLDLHALLVQRHLLLHGCLDHVAADADVPARGLPLAVAIHSTTFD